MKNYIFLSVIFLSSVCFADENWQQHWENGRVFLSVAQHEKATLEFDHAVSLMSEEEITEYPFVLVDRAESEYSLGNYTKVMNVTEKALSSTNLTDHERLECGMKRIAALMKLGQEDAAVEEYKKYVIGCPLFPKYDYFKEKIIIRNMPDCEDYKKFARNLMISNFCNENDISEYDNTWVVNITKKYNCQIKKGNNINYAPRDSAHKKRGPAEAYACCGTVNKLAVAANVICGCVSTPFGPVTSTTCKVACALFIEGLRQAGEWCCNNGGIEEKCWKNFETWKVDFKREYPECPKPPKECVK